jgi:hypothetical protein
VWSLHMHRCILHGGEATGLALGSLPEGEHLSEADWPSTAEPNGV